MNTTRLCRKPGWADTSSNGLISDLFKTADSDIKQSLEMLMNDETVEKELNEQIIFSQLDTDESAIWSLMLASGYLKVVSVEKRPESNRKTYSLRLTNLEVRIMFDGLIRDWFGTVRAKYNDFVSALLKGDAEGMNYYMNEITINTFSYLDTGRQASKKAEPERFYHGFVLGLLAELRGRYVITSNRESEIGRYDVMMEPVKADDFAFIFEFKVFNPKKEASLEDTVAAALKQIEEKHYSALLEEKGVEPNRIRKYGFAFESKNVLIG